MDSFLSVINKFSVGLDLATTQRWKMNQDGAFVKECNDPIDTKAKVLQFILSAIKKAPFYCIANQSSQKFLIAVTKFSLSASPSEKKEITKTVLKIEQFVLTKFEQTHLCFKTEAAQATNILLDKKTDLLQQKDCEWLYKLAEFLAYKRKLASFFYAKAAIAAKVSELLQQNPDIRLPSVPQYDQPLAAAIPFPYLENPNDFQFVLFIEFYHKNYHTTYYKDLSFNREIFKRRLETSDLAFKNHLNIHLALNQIFALCDLWNSLSGEQQLILDLNKNSNRGTSVFSHNVAEYNSEPESYFNYWRTANNLSPFSPNSGMSQIVLELHESTKECEKDFNRLYEGLYQKIEEYRKSHPTTVLPLLTPEEYKSCRGVIQQDDLAVPLISHIRQWEAEALKAKAPLKVSVSKELSLSALNFLGEEPDAPRPSLPMRNYPFPKIDALETPLRTPAAPLLPPKSIHQKFTESSPFLVDKRITDWFDPASIPVALNNESRLVHDFAWAVNDVLWQFGLRYPRQHDKGYFQPAIAMLCQVQRPEYGKTQLFRITATFDQRLKESNNEPLMTSYEPTWTCYHRTLTRRPQNNQDVEDYIAIGKNQFVEFPPLPSQRLQIEVPEALLRKKYPDQSFVESVSGSVIVIRDPKNDKGQQKCRIHLFVVS